MANNYTHTEIIDLVDKFNNLTLPAKDWTHQAHLVVAIWYSFHYDFPIALDLVRAGIRRYNEVIDTPNTDSQGYHETITQFWLWTVRRFISVNRDYHDSILTLKMVLRFLAKSQGRRFSKLINQAALRLCEKHENNNDSIVIITNKEKRLVDNCNEFLNSQYNDKTYPFLYYSQEVLFSVKARMDWVKPDLQPLNKLI